MGQTLEHGIFLPDEGERNCYDGLAANWRALDAHLGNTDIHVTYADKQAWNEHVADTVKHVTASDKQAWNEHVADTVKHVTASDKQAWNGHVADTDKHVTAADKTTWNTVTSKANDSDVVHKSGDETITGVKTFSDNPLVGNGNTNITISNRQIIANGSASTTGNHAYSFMQLLAKVTYADSSSPITGTVVLEINEDAYADGKSSAFYANSNNLTNLGKSGKRWANVYATNYYYGGSEIEFSQKFVTTDTNQTINGNKTFGNGTLIVNNTTGSNVHGEIKLNGSRSGYIVADNASDGVFDSIRCGVSILLQDSNKPLHIGGYQTDSNGRVFADNTNKNPVLSITGSLVKTSVLVPENETVNPVFRILSELNYANGNPSKTLDVRFIQYDNASGSSAIYSNDDGKTSLGVSSRKWSDVLTYKINSVEPSSLSLPSSRDSRVDISSYFTDTSNGGVNRYTVPANGYIYLNVTDVISMHILAQTSNNLTHYGDTRGRNSVGQLYALLPVKKDDVFACQWYTTATNVTLNNAYFIPCLGNV